MMYCFIGALATTTYVWFTFSYLIFVPVLAPYDFINETQNEMETRNKLTRESKERPQTIFFFCFEQKMSKSMHIFIYRLHGIMKTRKV